MKHLRSFQQYERATYSNYSSLNEGTVSDFFNKNYDRIKSWITKKIEESGVSFEEIRRKLQPYAGKSPKEIRQIIMAQIGESKTYEQQYYDPARGATTGHGMPKTAPSREEKILSKPTTVHDVIEGIFGLGAVAGLFSALASGLLSQITDYANFFGPVSGISAAVFVVSFVLYIVYQVVTGRWRNLDV